MMRRLRWCCANAEEVLCAAIMAAMTVLGFANVVSRYAGYALAYTEELLVMMLVWLTLLGAAVGFKRRAHLGLSFVRDALPRPWQKAAEAAGGLVTAGTMGLVVWLCAAYQVPDEIATKTTTAALDIPQVYYTLAIPVGGLAVMVRAVQSSWRVIRETDGKSES